MSDTPDLTDSLTVTLGGAGILTKDSLTRLSAIARRRVVLDGTEILREGALSDELYVIERGAVVVFHADPVTGARKDIARLPAGDLLGELALIDGGPRTLSARAEGDCELIEISPSLVAAAPDGARLLTDLRGALSYRVVGKMRAQNDQLIAGLRREIDTAKTQRQFGLFFIFMLIILCIGAFVSNLVTGNVLDTDVHSQTFVWTYTAVLLMPTLLVIWKMRIPIAELGLGRVGLGRSLREGSIVSVVVVVLVGIAVLARHLLNIPAARPFEFEPLGAAAYLLHSFMQELVGRGVIQTSFQKFLDDTRGLLSIALSAIVFGTMHLHLGVLAVAVTFIGSCLFGLLYRRHQHLAGVTLVHFTAGVAVFAAGLI